MDEKVTRYVNQDLAYKTEEQKNNEFKVKVPSLDDFIGELEFALMFLNFKDTSMFFEETGEHQFHLRTFDGAILKTNHLLDKNLEVLNPLTNDIRDFNSQLIENLNFKIFDLNAGTDNKQRLFQIRKIQPEKLRANPKLQGQKIFECRESWLNNNEKWYSYGKYYKAYQQQMKNELLEMLYPTTIKPGYFINDLEAKAFMQTSDYYQDLMAYYVSISGALSAYYEWFVYIRENENSIGIKVPVNPESTKEIFSLRNVEEGKRKKAICNFVKDHLRILPINNYNEEYRQVLVHQHLRGQNKFIWRGLEVHVIPAQYDLNRIKTSKKFINK
jgi:hypothetical protein